jgi:UDP-N-acetylglucosamine diphosphorylase/glucosamine-1-phosphate N-acetyltransferase
MFRGDFFYFCQMSLILFDHAEYRENLLPFTFTRPVAGIRVGILTIAEKWEKHLSAKPAYACPAYLSGLFKATISDDNLLINGSLLPSPEIINEIKALKSGEGLFSDSIALAYKLNKVATHNFIDAGDPGIIQVIQTQTRNRLLANTWDIFRMNGEEIRNDFKLITQGRKSAEISDPYTIVYAPENVFVEEGASIKAAIINAENGPVYIGKNAVVQEGAIIAGALALCEGSHINMGAKMRGDNTIGPFSKVGGEISNSVIFGYSNKGHDGFLGNSVLGEWCNIGADTNVSNLKNNYAFVKLWNYRSAKFDNTGLQFCGLMMGDHSKAGINTMFNTGTVVGVGANIFGAGFPRNFIPSFSWGGAAGFTNYRIDRFFEMANAMMQRRGKSLSDEEKEIFAQIFAQTSSYRS